jgi:hypothetical protein
MVPDHGPSWKSIPAGGQRRAIFGSYPWLVPDPQERPRPEPLDPPMVPFAVGGLVVWAVAGLVLLFFRGWLAEHGHTDWLWICLAGFLVGLPGLAVMIRHDSRR